MFVAFRLLNVMCCSLCVVRRSWFAVCWLLFVVVCYVLMLFVLGCCALRVVWCVLVVVRCALLDFCVLLVVLLVG